MSELTLLVLKLGLLGLMWIFVFIVIYSVRSDMFGPRIPRTVRAAAEAQRSEPAPAPATEAPTQAVGTAASSETLRRIVITAGPKAGTSLDLPETGLTIGRSSGAGLQVSDDYTSTNHARIAKQGDTWIVEDLGSTNGTFLAGKRVADTAVISANTTIRVGTTQFELRP